MSVTRSDSLLIPELMDSLEIRTAERDRAAQLLDRLDRIIPRTAHLGHPEQTTIREVQAFLVECGIRKADTDRAWVDRVCICEPCKLGEGTNSTPARIVNAACALHGERL